MRQHNILSKKVTLAVAVAMGQIISLTGKLATTGTAGAEPKGVALSDGVAGDTIAIMSIGLIDVPQDGTLALGDGVKANAGALVKATTTAESFAVVSEVNSAKSVEIMLT